MEKQDFNDKRFLKAGSLFLIILLLQMFGLQYLPYALARIPYLVPSLFACFYFIVVWITAFYRELPHKKLILYSVCTAGVFIIVYVLCNLSVAYAVKTLYDSVIFENKLFFTLFETLCSTLTACVPPILAGIPFVRLRPVSQRAKLYAVSVLFAYIVLCLLLNGLLPHDLFEDFGTTSFLSYLSLLAPSVSYQIWQKSVNILTALFPFVYALVLVRGQYRKQAE